MNTNPIEDFILSSERNLEIAIAVSAATATARGRLVSEFLKRLGENLQKVLKDWKFEFNEGWFVDSYPSFYMWKPAWKEEYFLDLCCYDRGTTMSFGVSRDPRKPQVKKRPHCTELLAAIQRVHPSAKSAEWWEARMRIATANGDWSDSAILWRMHKDPKFLEEVATELLKVAKIAGPILDRFIKRR